jgi:ATP-dependent DNA ligase
MTLPRFDTAQLTLFRTPFNDADFIFELKVDGFRGLAYIDDGVCELVSRRRNSYKSFKDLQSSLGKLRVRNAVIDGEIACLDDQGRSIFNELLFRRGSPIFYAFDLLYLNDRDLRQLPLIERKEKLRAVIEKSQLPDILCGKFIEERGVDLFNEVTRRNLEGMVGKRKNGIYATVSGWLGPPNSQTSAHANRPFRGLRGNGAGTSRDQRTLPNHCLTVKVDIPDRFDCYRCRGINICQ